MNESPNNPWWIWAVAGVVTLAVGIIVLFEPGKSLEALMIITGIYLLFDAALAFARSISGAAGDRGLAAMHGVVALVIGLILVRHPIETVSFVAILVGIWLLTVGCVVTVAAFQSPEHRGLRLLVGLVQAIAGAVIIAQPSIGYNTLAIIAGISLTLQGLGMLALAWSQRKVEAAV
jgi:uncharacterized membrane protein HdeD (DUF308 family)